MTQGTGESGLPNEGSEIYLQLPLRSPNPRPSVHDTGPRRGFLPLSGRAQGDWEGNSGLPAGYSWSLAPRSQNEPGAVMMSLLLLNLPSLLFHQLVPGGVRLTMGITQE